MIAFLTLGKRYNLSLTLMDNLNHCPDIILNLLPQISVSVLLQTGAFKYVCTKNVLTFNVKSNRPDLKIRISYDYAQDSYNIEILQQNQILDSSFDIYSDELGDVILRLYLEHC